jgi:hypothetical protein
MVVPQPYAAVFRPRKQVLAVRGELDSHDRSIVILDKGSETLAGRHVPNPNQAIVRTGYDHSAIAVKVNTRNGVSMGW